MSDMKQTCQTTVNNARTWLVPLLVGGQSTAWFSPIGVTAERLAEPIVLGIADSLGHGGDLSRFTKPRDDDFLSFETRGMQCQSANGCWFQREWLIPECGGWSPAIAETDRRRAHPRATRQEFGDCYIADARLCPRCGSGLVSPLISIALQSRMEVRGTSSKTNPSTRYLTSSARYTACGANYARTSTTELATPGRGLIT